MHTKRRIERRLVVLTVSLALAGWNLTGCEDDGTGEQFNWNQNNAATAVVEAATDLEVDDSSSDDFTSDSGGAED